MLIFGISNISRAEFLLHGDRSIVLTKHWQSKIAQYFCLSLNDSIVRQVIVPLKVSIGVYNQVAKSTKKSVIRDLKTTRIRIAVTIRLLIGNAEKPSTLLTPALSFNSLFSANKKYLGCKTVAIASLYFVYFLRIFDTVRSSVRECRRSRWRPQGVWQRWSGLRCAASAPMSLPTKNSRICLWSRRTCKLIEHDACNSRLVSAGCCAVSTIGL